MDKRKRTYKGVPVTKLEEDVLMAMHNPGGPNLQIHYDALSVTNGCVIASYITGIHERSIPKQVCKNLERKRHQTKMLLRLLRPAEHFAKAGDFYPCYLRQG